MLHLESLMMKLITLSQLKNIITSIQDKRRESLSLLFPGEASKLNGYMQSVTHWSLFSCLITLGQSSLVDWINSSSFSLVLQGRRSWRLLQPFKLTCNEPGVPLSLFRRTRDPETSS
ncbi:hypothetical protein HAX54_009929 [Datura stramonium]|uniref:Uncharacterized protein n=1 Tax=Datura stramonium TaxID=4076 RepID=A0ABS8TH70_DATST|nr:hypothetical protein [Datura stramonium]